ncbi:hypothetical protein Enr17x_08670 [Gimesia fumaroli]|uniref:Uncharacterized protein n=1 Tax=Gimesia fumaroli TaxID=2527976 RepID=A0A518I6Z4_9PLAN|nr:hypothetical protein Enr17x_08670 [Gimesia fumaroli]
MREFSELTAKTSNQSEKAGLESDEFSFPVYEMILTCVGLRNLADLSRSSGYVSRADSFLTADNRWAGVLNH